MDWGWSGLAGGLIPLRTLWVGPPKCEVQKKHTAPSHNQNVHNKDIKLPRIARSSTVTTQSNIFSPSKPLKRNHLTQHSLPPWFVPPPRRAIVTAGIGNTAKLAQRTPGKSL